MPQFPIVGTTTRYNCYSSQYVGLQAMKKEFCAQNLHRSGEGFLDANYHFIAVPKKFKRYGSFVPGPLESRRRLGKRKMAYAFESIYCYKFGFWSWWKYLRGTDLTDWKWQPPRSVMVSLEPQIQVAQPLLPSWLLRSLKNFKEQSRNISLISHFQHTSSHLLQEELCHLKAAVQTGSTDTIMKVTRILSYKLNRAMIQSSICDEELLNFLEKVSDELREKMIDLKLTTSLCSLFQSAWEGSRNSIAEEKVTHLPRTTIFILQELSKVPFIFEVQELVTNLIQHTLYLENEVLYEIYCSIFTSWALSLHKDFSVMSIANFSNEYSSYIHQCHVSDAEENILRVEHMISNIQNEIYKGMDENNLNVSLGKIKLEILSCLKIVENAENIMMPEKLSASNLLKAVGYLPKNVIRALLKDCSQRLCEEFNQEDLERCLNIKRQWLLSISQVSALSSDEFLDIWKYMDTYSEPLPENLSPQILINMWELQGDSRSHALIKNSIETAAYGSNEGHELWVSLVSAIYKYDPPKLHFNKINRILQILFSLGKIDIIGKTIFQMSSTSPRLPAEILEFVVEITTDQDPDMAWKIVMLSYRMKPGRKYKSNKYPRGDFRTLRFSHCPKFVIWMILNSELSPVYIWKILRIPFHAKYRPRYRNQPSNKLLDPGRINLLKLMANAFAYSERLPPRIAFRNVMQCWHHLRHYRTPIDKTIIHALLHSGVARCIESGIWIPQGRKVWLLSLVEQVEGFQIAEKVDNELKVWNSDVTYKKCWARRELNVLRVGPID